MSTLTPHGATRACLALGLVVGLTGPAARAQEALVPTKVSEDAAVAMVREQTDGKVVRVDRKLEGGASVYRIRVLSPDGRLREFRVDAATGSLR